jgi:hypothetical protein
MLTHHFFIISQLSVRIFVSCQSKIQESVGSLQSPHSRIAKDQPSYQGPWKARLLEGPRQPANGHAMRDWFLRRLY